MADKENTLSPSEADIEAAAQAIYEDWVFQSTTDGPGQFWVPGGNSTKQDEARRFARLAIEVDRKRRGAAPGEADLRLEFQKVYSEGKAAGKAEAEASREEGSKDQLDAQEILRGLYQSAQRGLYTSEVSLPERRYIYSVKFTSLADLNAYERAWTDILLASLVASLEAI